ncbi:MAG: DUF559 domain-containing protein [Longimicrobiales bacterium]
MGSRTTQRTDIEEVIARFAARQHGVVARAQLLRAGVAADVVDYRLRTGRLRSIYRAVYVAGPLPLPNAREMAAVLACGNGAAVSHRSAASLWQLLPRGDEASVVEVAVKSGRAGNRPGIRVHRLRTLRKDEVTTQDRIPVTTPARTLYDLGGVTTPRALERALAEAMARRVTTRSRMLSVLDCHPKGRGVSALRALLESRPGPALTRSEAEERFLALVRKARLREPEVNVMAQGNNVDFYWRVDRLVVEIDGRAYHSSPQAFERDHQRDATLVAAGLRVMRVTWRQIVDEPEAVLVRLAQALAR